MSDFQMMLEQARTGLADRPLVVLLLTFVLMWLFARIGGWLARRRVVDVELEGRSVFGVVVTATLTLLALIVGFTFSMALSRYDERKNLEEAEANAIGTEWVRADLLPKVDADKVRALLRSYLDERIARYVDRAQRAADKPDAHMVQLQDQMWATVAGSVNAQPNPVNVLVASGMNDVLNSQGYTQAAWLNRIPLAAWLLLAALALFSNLLVGFEVQRTGVGGVVPYVLPIAVSIACCLIADLESPRGLITVQPLNLMIVARSLPAP
jgi:hypothetical protein